MNNDIFLEWIKHFIQHAKPSQEERVLLILDGHESHTHNIEALELASKSGVIMLSLPPHTSHRMHPLDLTFFKLLKTYYYQQIEAVHKKLNRREEGQQRTNKIPSA